MAPRRSKMSSFWLQLGLQAAFLVTAASAAEPAYAKPALLAAPSDDAFVYVAPIETVQPALSSFEDFSMDFYLPVGPAPSYDAYVDASAPLPLDDYALLGGPAYDYRSDDFLFAN